MKTVAITALLFLFMASYSQAEPPAFLTGHEPEPEQDESEAVRSLMNSMLDLYAPSLKLKFIQYEKMFEEWTRFSGTISLRSRKNEANPTMAGEAHFRSGSANEAKAPLVHWSIKTSLDFSSAAIGMHLWKETPFGRVSFAHELEQDFSEEFSYRGLLKLEKNF